MLEFPTSATETERQAFNQLPCLREITSEEVGLADEYAESDQRLQRFATRILLRRDNGKICMVKSMKYGYIAVPGGEIDLGENITEAMRRETREETGYEISNVRPLGYVLEHRPDKEETTYVFTAQPQKNVGTAYMEDEIADDFAPVWMDIDEVIQTFEKIAARITTVSSQGGRFATMRDLTLVQYLKKI